MPQNGESGQSIVYTMDWNKYGQYDHDVEGLGISINQLALQLERTPPLIVAG